MSAGISGNAAIEVTEHAEEPTAVVCGHAAGAELPGFLGAAFGEVMQQLTAQHVAPAGPPFARYRPTEDGFDVEAGFPASRPVAPAGRVEPSTLPAGAVATSMYQGAYSGVAEAYRAIAEWLPAHGYAVTGAPWESYLDGPEVAEPRTLVSFPCARA